MAGAFQRRALRKAAEALGGEVHLRRFLEVPSTDLYRWLRNQAPVPTLWCARSSTCSPISSPPAPGPQTPPTIIPPDSASFKLVPANHAPAQLERAMVPRHRRARRPEAHRRRSKAPGRPGRVLPAGNRAQLPGDGRQRGRGPGRGAAARDARLPGVLRARGRPAGQKRSPPASATWCSRACRWGACCATSCPGRRRPTRCSMPRAAVEVVVEAPFGPLRVMTTHLEYYSKDHRAAQIDRLRELHREACARAPSGRRARQL